MEPGSDPFKFMMEVDKLAGDLHRLGDKSVTELRKCVIIVSGLSADFEMECRMLENNPDGLNRGEIERVVGNQYNRLLKQQQDSKVLSASRGTVTANRENGKNRRLCNKFEGKCFNCGKKGHRAVDCRSTKKKSEKSGTAVERKEGGGGGRCYVCESVEHLAHKHCRLCRSLEHRTRDCEERGAEKDAMLAKLTAPAVPELSIKCIRTDNGGDFEGEFRRELYRRSITHEHTPPDTPQYNGVAERALGLLREKAIILMEELDDVINVPREKLWVQAMLFACDVTNKSVTTSTNEGKSPYELWFGKSPTAYHLRPFGMVGYARQSMREHKMAPKGEKCVFMGIPRIFPTGTVSVLLVRSRNIVERQALQWIDGPKKTGSDGTGSDDRGMKPAGGDIIVERGTPQLNVQELGQEQHEHEWQEAISELEGETQGALSDHGEDTQEVLSEDEREQQDEEGGAEARSTSLEGPTVPALRKLAIDGNVPLILSSRTRSRKPHTGVEGEALRCFSPAIEAEEENGVEDGLACGDEGQMAMQAKLDVSEPRNRRQAMESHEWDE